MTSDFFGTSVADVCFPAPHDLREPRRSIFPHRVLEKGSGDRGFAGENGFVAVERIDKNVNWICYKTASVAGVESCGSWRVTEFWNDSQQLRNTLGHKRL